MLCFTLHAIGIGRLDDTLQDFLQEGTKHHISEGDTGVGGTVPWEYVRVPQRSDVKQGDAEAHIKHYL